MQNTSPFDKLETESGRAFSAFCVYRDLGPARSLIGAYRYETGRKQVRSIPGQWRDWYDRYDWKRRAESWDGEQDRRRRDEAAETHRMELETYRERVLTRARALGDASMLSLEKGVAALEEVDVSKMRPGEICQFIMTAGRCFEISARLEGIALGVLDERGELLLSREL